MSLLICFSGQIGSGKSSVSTEVAAALGWRCAGFGDYLRTEIIRLGGDPKDRKALQDLGQRRVADDPVAFCRDLLAAKGYRAGDDLVIDGVRHIKVFEILKSLCLPSQGRLLFLGAQESTRLVRIGARADASDFGRASSHQVEADLQDALPQRADGIINADQPFDRVVADCLSLIQQWQRNLHNETGTLC